MEYTIDEILEEAQKQKSQQAVVPPPPQQTATQIIEVPPLAPTDDDAALAEARRKKVTAFEQECVENGMKFKLSGEEEEDNDPGEQPEFFEEIELEDYTGYEDTETVKSELYYRRRTGWIGVSLSLVFECTLLFTGFLVSMTGAPPMGAAVYLFIQCFLLLALLLVNLRAVGGGLASLFRMRADGNSGAAIATVAALLHTSLQFFNTDAVTSGGVQLLAPAAGLSLLLCAIGRQARTLRICRNFDFVSQPGEKTAVSLIENPQKAEEIGRPATALGEPRVAYSKRTCFLNRFLEYAYAEDAADHAMRVFIPLLTAGTVGIGLGYWALHPGLWQIAVTIGVSAFCMCVPAAMTAIHFPAGRAAKKAGKRGGMLCGWSAVKSFGEPDGLAVDASDLFPPGNVLLHGIKTFSGARIDEAILDAASVSIKAGGPLAAVFRRIIENKEEILRPVDTLMYEQDMGLSGWVGGRRVLVGNSRLLINHGVDVPSKDYEHRYTGDGRQLVYLSVAGELCALFVLSYLPNEPLAQALRALNKTGVTLLVNTCDPNMTEDLICRTLDLDPYYVEIITAAAGRAYEELMQEELPALPSLIAGNGQLEDTAATLTYCHRLRKSGHIAVAAQVLAGGCGFALCAVLAFYGGVVASPLFMTGYIAGSAVLSWIAARFAHI